MGEIKGFRLYWRGPTLTNLLFANDSLLFCRVTSDECRKIINILEKYEGELGQKVNKNKTTIFFSKSTMEATKQEIMIGLGLQEIVHFEQYLGLPSLVGKRKKEGFNFIKEKVWRKLQGWEGKLLSQASHKVLIKAVIQAIPTYAMGYFKIPLGLCHEIETMIKKFWWGQRGEKRKIHWLKSKELTKPKLEGGMGFRDIAMFNDSSMATLETPELIIAQSF